MTAFMFEYGVSWKCISATNARILLHERPGDLRDSFWVVMHMSRRVCLLHLSPSTYTLGAQKHAWPDSMGVTWWCRYRISVECMKFNLVPVSQEHDIQFRFLTGSLNPVLFRRLDNGKVVDVSVMEIHISFDGEHLWEPLEGKACLPWSR